MSVSSYQQRLKDDEGKEVLVIEHHRHIFVADENREGILVCAYVNGDAIPCGGIMHERAWQPGVDIWTSWTWTP